jgi:hypothetical protein
MYFLASCLDHPYSNHPTRVRGQFHYKSLKNLLSGVFRNLVNRREWHLDTAAMRRGLGAAARRHDLDRASGRLPECVATVAQVLSSRCEWRPMRPNDRDLITSEPTTAYSVPSST